MRKYAYFIESYYDSLVEVLNKNNLSDKIHFSHSLPDFDKQLSREMSLLSGLDVEYEDKLKYLGTYYSMKLVELNVTMIDYMKPEVIKSDPLKVYMNFMREIGWKFRSLTSIFLENLVPILSRGLNTPQFIIASVGTRTDLDDIDVAVITVEEETRDLDKLLSRINKILTKYGTPMHFHLAESINNNKYSATVDEFADFAIENISNFVFITEIIGAKKIYGPKEIMDSFENAVQRLFYQDYTSDIRFHEAYLRMILGEIRLYLNRPIESQYINPKNDALRMIKALLSIQKTRYGVFKKNPWAVLDKLKYLDSKNWDIYKAIGESLAFIETFRFLFMLYGTQEEQIYLDLPENIRTINQVSTAMGIGSIGAVSKQEHILIRYYDHLRRVKKIVQLMLEDCREYLKRITLVNEILSENRGNLAVNFAKNSGIYKSSDFWDDILESFASDDYKLLKVFTKDYLALNERLRKVILKGLFSHVEYTFDGLVSFIIMLEKLPDDEEFHRVAEEFLGFLMECLDRNPDLLFSLVGFFEKDNIGFCRLLENIDRESLRKIQKSFSELKEDFSERKLKKSKNENFKNILTVYSEGSRYFRKYFQRIILSDPWIVKLIESEEKIEDICSGIFADIFRTVNRQLQKSLLTRFYILKFLNIGLEGILGKPFDEISGSFMDLNDDYLTTLFDICSLEMEEQKSIRLRDDDKFMLLVAGSMARGSSFNDDIDLVAVFGSEDLKTFSTYNKILSKMSREIVRTGTLPQFRLADHFGTYVTKLNDLKNLFADDSSENFIEKSQILESKFLVGSESFLQKFKNEFIENQIFSNWEIFARNMIEEIRNRHADNSNFIYNVKESPGGIKDIEMVVLVLKAKHRVTFKFGDELLEDLRQKIPGYAGELDLAFMHLKQLREIRQCMRLTVAKTNIVDVAEIFRNFKASIIPYHGKSWSDFDEFYRDIMVKSKNNIAKLVQSVFV